MKSPRILIVRLSAIGDAIQSMPVACALRERFPEAFLAWAVESRTAALLRGHEALNELIELPRGWLKSPSEVWRLRRKLREMHFDVTIDVQSLTKSAVLARLSGARRRIGFGNPGGRELSKWFNNERIDPKATHVVDRYLELLRPLGIESPTVRFQVPEREEDCKTAEDIIRQLGLALNSPDTGAIVPIASSGADIPVCQEIHGVYGRQECLPHCFAIINPGAGWPSKLWPADRYAAVARHLGEARRIPTLVVWAGQAEKTLAEQIVQAGGPSARISPPTSLPELAALARRAKLFLGADTGPLHLAAAVGTPCVGLYGPWPAARHGPYGPKNIALQKMFFEGSARARRTAPAIYMESITTEMVCEACDRILKSCFNT